MHREEVSRIGAWKGENQIFPRALTMLRPYIRNRSVVAAPASPLMRAVMSAAARTMSVKHTEGIRDTKSHRYEDIQ